MPLGVVIIVIVIVIVIMLEVVKMIIVVKIEIIIKIVIVNIIVVIIVIIVIIAIPLGGPGEQLRAVGHEPAGHGEELLHTYSYISLYIYIYREI